MNVQFNVNKFSSSKVIMNHLSSLFNLYDPDYTNDEKGLGSITKTIYLLIEAKIFFCYFHKNLILLTTPVVGSKKGLLKEPELCYDKKMLLFL